MTTKNITLDPHATYGIDDGDGNAGKLKMTKMTKMTFRADNGRYDYSKMDRLCRCGHLLGSHFAVGPRACAIGTFGDDDVTCTCEKFQPAKRKST